MSVIQSDRRQIHFRDHPEVRARAAAALRRQLRDKLALARDLVVLHRDRAFVVEDCSTIGHFGMRHLGDPVETSALCDVGYALEAFPELEARLLEGRIPFRSAVYLGRVAQVGGGIRPEDQWIHLAATEPTHVVRREAEARLEEVKRGVVGVVEISAHVTAPEAERFERARVLASRKLRKSLTRGQTLVFLTDDFLERADPAKRGTAKRRMGPTSEKPGSRTIPREVLRQLRTRSGDRCEYPGCTHRMFLDKAHHKTPKARGGGQEIDDLGDLCGVHHRMHDAGRFHLVAWTRDFRPVYRRLSGELLWPQGALEPPAPPGGAGTVNDSRAATTWRARSPRPPVPARRGASGSAPRHPARGA